MKLNLANYFSKFPYFILIRLIRLLWADRSFTPVGRLPNWQQGDLAKANVLQKFIYLREHGYKSPFGGSHQI